MQQKKTEMQLRSKFTVKVSMITKKYYPFQSRKTIIRQLNLERNESNTVGPRYMREIGTPKIDSHMMNSNVKRPRMTDN